MNTSIQEYGSPAAHISLAWMGALSTWTKRRPQRRTQRQDQGLRGKPNEMGVLGLELMKRQQIS